MPQRKQYTPAFKLEIAKLMVEQNYTLAQACEAVEQMKAAQQLTNAICGAATQHPPLTSQTAQKPHPGTRDLDPEKPVEKFATPLILLDSPANINLASPTSRPPAANCSSYSCSTPKIK